jgi:hypothetical protein
VKVLLLADPEFARAEEALLRRLAAGLADEGVRVFSAVPRESVPQGVSYGSRLGVFATDVAYDATGLPLTTAWRARALLERVATGVTPGPPDLVHAWGRSRWEIAWAVAQAAGCPLLLEVWDWPTARAAVAWLGRLARLGRGVGAIRLSVADPALGEHTQRLMPPAAQGLVHVCPWGVHLGEDPADAADGAFERDASSAGPHPVLASTLARVLAPALALWPGGLGDTAQVDTFGFMQAVAARSPGEGLLVVVDQPSIERTTAWADARRLKITERLVVVPGHLAHWQAQWTAQTEAALEVQALVIPSNNASQSGLALEAMASGVPLIARADTRVSYLTPQAAKPQPVTTDPRASDQHTPDRPVAELVRSDDPVAWAGALAMVLDDPSHAATVAASARRFVKEQRLGFHHVTAVVRLYDQLAAQRAIR